MHDNIGLFNQSSEYQISKPQYFVSSHAPCSEFIASPASGHRETYALFAVNNREIIERFESDFGLCEPLIALAQCDLWFKDFITAIGDGDQANQDSEHTIAFCPPDSLTLPEGKLQLTVRNPLMPRGVRARLQQVNGPVHVVIDTMAVPIVMLFEGRSVIDFEHIPLSGRPHFMTVSLSDEQWVQLESSPGYQHYLAVQLGLQMESALEPHTINNASVTGTENQKSH
ncbi:hypothetical protein [uncultured Photobacterium sp.]|uniref:hypothetical protein n=1 Tax=uncultured Photobacterium sp. TaxID=173973 RepID=UPI00261F6DF2|nr:hypothetical protein [uncultured Photobacterium sp.]